MARTGQLEAKTRPSSRARFILRRMTAADIPQVMDIERESFPSMWPHTAFQKELKNRLARYFVLIEDAPEAPCPAEAPSDAGRSPWRRAMRRILGGEIEPEPTRELVIGMIGLWMMVDELHIVTIAVREAFRRQGAGELLVIVSVEFALARGMECVTLEYRRSNEAARALYEKYGFMNVGLRARYYSDDNEDAIIMSTPPLASRSHRELYERLRREHQVRWRDRYVLPEQI